MRRLLVLAGALVVVVLASIMIGSRAVPLHVLFAPDGSDASYVVWQLRVPRTLAGVLAGVALGLAGALMQALTRNPLAEPGLFGVNAGAAAATAVAVVFGLTPLPFAFAGAAIAVLVLGFLASGTDPVRLALGGMAVSAALTGVTQAVLLLDASTFDKLRMWTVGSLNRADYGAIVVLAVCVLVGLGLALALARSLNALALGDEAGRALGASTVRTRVGALLAVTLLAGGATAAVGPLAFVGLAVPHLARHLTGPDQRRLLPACVLVGPVLLLSADVIGRVIAETEIDVGVITALLGAPLFILLARRARSAL